jgi:hypothetical protein
MCVGTGAASPSAESALDEGTGGAGWGYRWETGPEGEAGPLEATDPSRGPASPKNMLLR